jgi:methionine-rich copper-binding protein CopC
MSVGEFQKNLHLDEGLPLILGQVPGPQVSNVRSFRPLSGTRARTHVMRLIIAAASALFVAISAGAASAHAHLDHADPRAGSSLASAPRQISLWFTQNLEPAFSNIEVRDSNGIRVDQGQARLDPSNPKLLQIELKALSPGTYKVLWHVLSVDTHTTEGQFTFRVGGQ